MSAELKVREAVSNVFYKIATTYDTFVVKG
jgi:hypothetical protein